MITVTKCIASTKLILEHSRKLEKIRIHLFLIILIAFWLSILGQIKIYFNDFSEFKLITISTIDDFNIINESLGFYIQAFTKASKIPLIYESK